MIERTILGSIRRNMQDKKAILILGPRQTGKTTLILEIARMFEGKHILLNADEALTRNAIEGIQSVADWRLLIGDARLVLIDEAQRVKDIGLRLKLMTDHFPEVKLVVTGSSAFELANTIQEPLTGRKWEYQLLPFSVEEMVGNTHYLDEKGKLHTRLIYGAYPDVVQHPGSEQEILSELANAYLYKDIFSFQDIRKPELLTKLLKALATTVGSEVTYNYLAKLLDSDKGTIERYIDLLEKTYVVFRLHSFSRNVRTELKKSRKIYFYDNGIRNALLGAYQPLPGRQDIGALWENYMVSERLKFLRHHRLQRNVWFWRTHLQQEIDYIEEYDGKLDAYEFKWSEAKTSTPSKTFMDAYPQATFRHISPKDYVPWLLPS